MTELSGVVSVGVAAKMVGTSRAYIQRMADEGRIAATRTPIGRLLNEVSVRDFARARRQRIKRFGR